MKIRRAGAIMGYFFWLSALTCRVAHRSLQRKEPHATSQGWAEAAVADWDNCLLVTHGRL